MAYVVVKARCFTDDKELPMGLMEAMQIAGPVLTACGGLAMLARQLTERSSPGAEPAAQPTAGPAAYGCGESAHGGTVVVVHVHLPFNADGHGDGDAAR